MSSSLLHFGLYVRSDAGSRPATDDRRPTTDDRRPTTDDEIISIALLALNKELERAVGVSSPAEVKAYLSLRLGALPHEVFGVLFLDAQSRVIEFREMFRGTLTQTAVYPREVVKEALQLNAAAVILSHNHPSGVAEPSRADEYLTRSLQEALKLVDVRVLDHIVVGGGQAMSFAELGLL